MHVLFEIIFPVGQLLTHIPLLVRQGVGVGVGVGAGAGTSEHPFLFVSSNVDAPGQLLPVTHAPLYEKPRLKVLQLSHLLGEVEFGIR